MNSCPQKHLDATRNSGNWHMGSHCGDFMSREEVALWPMTVISVIMTVSTSLLLFLKDDRYLVSILQECKSEISQRQTPKQLVNVRFRGTKNGTNSTAKIRPT